MLIIPILHPNYSLLLNFINNPRISIETEVLQNEKTGSRNKYIKTILKPVLPAREKLRRDEPCTPQEATWRWHWAVTQNHSHSSRCHKTPWDDLRQAVPSSSPSSRERKACNGPEASPRYHKGGFGYRRHQDAVKGSTELLNRHISVVRGGKLHHKPATGKPYKVKIDLPSLM